MLQAKAAAEKAKNDEKVQTAKAKVLKVKAEVKQKKELRVKRVATAYTLFMKDRITAVSHVPAAERFKVRFWSQTNDWFFTGTMLRER